MIFHFGHRFMKKLGNSQMQKIATHFNTQNTSITPLIVKKISRKSKDYRPQGFSNYILMAEVRNHLPPSATSRTSCYTLFFLGKTSQLIPWKVPRFFLSFSKIFTEKKHIGSWVQTLKKTSTRKSTLDSIRI